MLRAMGIRFLAIVLGVALGSCAIPEISTEMTGQPQRKATKGTGSNIARERRDPALEGWRAGMGRIEMWDFQKGRPLVSEGGGTPVGGKANWYKQVPPEPRAPGARLRS